MITTKTIRRSEVLTEISVHETAGKKIKTFSIQFYKKNGEVIFFKNAKSCGLKFSMKNNRMRGIQQVDEMGESIGHVTPVSIDNIREYNGIRVKI